MKYSNLNDNRITVEAGIANGLIGKARKRGSLSQDSISKILCKYRSLNARWLLTGEGEMLVNENKVQSEEAAEIYKEQLAQKEKKIEELNREIGRLETKLSIINGEAY